MQKIALILGSVRRFQKLAVLAPCAQACVVAGGDPGGTQALHVVQADAELDLAIAEHVRIGRAARGVFAQE